MATKRIKAGTKWNIKFVVAILGCACLRSRRSRVSFSAII